jgi:hypothetical protein
MRPSSCDRPLRSHSPLGRPGQVCGGSCPGRTGAVVGATQCHRASEPVILTWIPRRCPSSSTMCPPPTHVDRGREVQTTASSPRGAFSQAELTAKLVTRRILGVTSSPTACRRRRVGGPSEPTAPPAARLPGHVPPSSVRPRAVGHRHGSPGHGPVPPGPGTGQARANLRAHKPAHSRPGGPETAWCQARARGARNTDAGPQGNVTHAS